MERIDHVFIGAGINTLVAAATLSAKFARVFMHATCSPADLEAMNINLVGGDPCGGACSIDQFFLWRPFARSTNGTTPIRGLAHIGALTHPGPGLGGGSGFGYAKRMGA